MRSLYTGMCRARHAAVPQVLAQSKEKCQDVSWHNTLAQLRNTTFDGKQASRQWFFQTCSEFGWVGPSSSSHHPCVYLHLTIVTTSLSVVYMAYVVTHGHVK
jgi:hypothetical protein